MCSINQTYFGRSVTLPYDERGGSVHADDSAINPAQQPLHYQLNVPSGWTLQRQNSLRYDNRPKHQRQAAPRCHYYRAH